jgi:hypothetical protein
VQRSMQLATDRSEPALALALALARRGEAGGAPSVWPRANVRTHAWTSSRFLPPFFPTWDGDGDARARGVDGTTKKAFGPIVPRWPEMTVPFVFLFPGASASQSEAGGMCQSGAADCNDGTTNSDLAVPGRMDPRSTHTTATRRRPRARSRSRAWCSAAATGF